jgi:heparan-alpha-glucosaminide N-acetyltransferase
MPYILYSVIYGFMNISLPEWMKEGIPGLIKCAFFAFLCIGITALIERYKIKIKV